MVSSENKSFLPPPEHILHAFSVKDREGEIVHRNLGSWIYDDIVLSPAFDPAIVSWSASLRENLSVPGIRIAKPILAKDGRYIVASWHADTFISGSPELRADEIISTSFRLHEALVDVPRPRFLSSMVHNIQTEVDIFAFADQVTWENNPLDRIHKYLKQNTISEIPVQIQKSTLVVLQDLMSRRQIQEYSSQIVHGDLYASLLFDGDVSPGLVDFTVYYRPKEWAAALVAIDALTWGGENEELLARWSDIPDWNQMLIQALFFRFLIYLLHPYSTKQGFIALCRAYQYVVKYLDK